MKVFTTHALLAALLSFAQAECPGSPWKEWNGHCYMMTQNQLNWHDARARCKSVSPYADVVSIHSKAENDFLRSRVVGSRRVWVGMRSHGQSQRWVDGTPVHFTNFLPGVSPADRTSDVVQLLGNNGYWKPASSYKGTKLHAVCKMASCKCREGWTRWGDACYLAKKEMFIDWLSAREQCQQMEPTSDLATITSAAENRIVFRLAGGKDRIWIGLNDRVREGKFRWNNRSDGVEYTNWFRHSSQRNSHAKDCAYMTRGGKWIASSCRQLGFYYVCKQLLCGCSSEPSPTRRGSDRVWRPEDSVRCPPGWSRSSSSAVDSALRPSCFSRPTAADTFAGVQSRCRAQHPDADVAVIRSLEDNDRAFLSAGALPMFIASDDQFDMQEESSSVGVGCVSLEPTGLWSSGRCAAGRLPGLCQMPACIPRCPNGWHLFQGQCYYVEERNLDAFSAEAACQRAGSKLASIHSQEENDFIEHLAYARRRNEPKRNAWMWIGARRETRGADWVWSDCSDWNFWHWDVTDGPKPAKDKNVCRRRYHPEYHHYAAMFSDGRWYVKCHPKAWSVCKLDPCRKQFGWLAGGPWCPGEEPPPTIPTTSTTTTTTTTTPTTTTTGSPAVEPACPQDGRQWTVEGHICLTTMLARPARHSDAFLDCRSDEADHFELTLPTLRTPAERERLLRLAAGADIWLALSRFGDGESHDWFWDDDFAHAITPNWEKPPPFISHNVWCGAMDGSTGGLIARHCLSKLPYLCQAHERH